MARTIAFYRTASGACPVEDFLNSLDSRQARKVTWVMQLVRDLAQPPAQYFKKLVHTELWEIRAQLGGNAFRLLGFLDGENLVVLTSGFAKKSEKTPRQEIHTAEQRMHDYFSRRNDRMDDLDKYIQRRKERDSEFARGYEAGYEEFKVGVLLRSARERAGVTQEELANAIHSKKSVISRLENQANDARVSTLRKVAQALGKELVIELRDAKRKPAGQKPLVSG